MELGVAPIQCILKQVLSDQDKRVAMHGFCWG